MLLPERYKKQVKLNGFGEEAQRKLLQARVLVIGCGGLGTPALQYLTAMGVGTLGIIDGDRIDISNLNRQILFSEDDAGKLKVDVAKQRLLQQNPYTSIEPFPAYLNVDNALQLIAAYDVVIDATDNIATRYLINDACVILHKPFVYGAIHRYEGQVSVFNFQDGPTYRCLYPKINTIIANCNDDGVLGVIPGIVGNYQALEAVKMITGIGKTLSGSLMLFDFLNNERQVIKLKAKAENKLIPSLQHNYEGTCNQSTTLSPSELYKMYSEEKKFLLLDIRELEEFEQCHFHKSISQPLHELVNYLQVTDEGVPIVAVCQKGIRSKSAVMMLKKNYNHLQIQNLEGGIDNWLQQFGDTFMIHG